MSYDKETYLISDKSTAAEGGEAAASVVGRSMRRSPRLAASLSALVSWSAVVGDAFDFEGEFDFDLFLFSFFFRLFFRSSPSLT